MYEIVIVIVVVTVIAAGGRNSISPSSQLAYQIRAKQPSNLNEDSKLAWLQGKPILSSNFSLNSAFAGPYWTCLFSYFAISLFLIPCSPQGEVVLEYTIQILSILQNIPAHLPFSIRSVTKSLQYLGPQKYLFSQLAYVKFAGYSFFEKHG